MTVECITLASCATVGNTGVHFDNDLSFKSQIRHVFQEAPYFTFIILLKLGKSYDKVMQKKLVYAFVTSRLEYCTSLLVCCPIMTLNFLQLIKNAAARVLMRVNRRYQS